MFQKPLSLKVAGLLGLAAGLFYVLFSLDFATQMQSVDPYADRDWKAVIEQVAQDAGPQMLTQAMAFLASVLLVCFLLATAARAAQYHPSLAALSGVFLLGSAGMLAFRAIWNAFVQVPMAITFHGTTDIAFRQLLQDHYRLDIFYSFFFAWSYVFLAAVGLILMGVALTPVKDMARLLPITFLLAGLACAAFIPAMAYVGNETFMTRHFDRILASRFLFLAWFLPGLAYLAAGTWLMREGFRLENPEDEEVTEIRIDKAA